jgi:hypothetical protein
MRGAEWYKGMSLSSPKSTWPQTDRSLVPVLFGLLSDIPLYHSAPRITMCGAAASVSTLLMVVGMPNRPDCAGNGGLIRGLPRFPSIEFIIAVSSPQMYAPAPRCSTRSMRVPLPKTLAPSAPLAYASSTARVITVQGSVNSPRMYT